jgi:N utilization substance protein A
MKKTVKKKLAKKSGTPKKKLAKKKPLKKAAVKTKALGKKTTGAKTPAALRTRVRRKSQSVDTETFALEGLRARGGQSGDLQGLSNIEGADSESVAELIEEGNAFEADAVTGVEHAGDNDEKEVRTHEVPQDDVPGEYLDKE